MAMDVGGAKGGVKSDINVTPLVDVMLVLLIIMMLIAPMLQEPVRLTLPQAKKTVAKPDTEDQTTVYVDSAGDLYVNALEVRDKDEAVVRVREALESKEEKVVYLKGDTMARYSAIMAMMDALRAAEIDNVALITATPAEEEAEGGH
jgi:biopolymer transport protein ExbD